MNVEIPIPELDPVAGVAATLLLGPELVVPEHLLGARGGGLVVAGVVGQPGDRGERELLVLDPVLLPDLEGVDADLDGELVHDPLDAVRRLGPAGAAVGVGPGLVGEHRLAGEAVGRELVDGVEHERAEHRHAAAHDGDVGTEVGQQLDLEAGDRAVLLRRQRQLLPLVAAVVGHHQRLAAGLGVLHRPAQPAGDRPGDPLLGRGLELAAEAAADVRRDHPDLRLGHARRGGQREAQDVGDLGRRPHGQLLTRRVDHDRAGLHEGRDQPLLAVLPLDHDAVGAGLGDGLLDVAAGAGLARVEHPQCGLVGAEVGMRERAALVGSGRSRLELERGG